jgi:hypothetical protein
VGSDLRGHEPQAHDLRLIALSLQLILDPRNYRGHL